MAISLFPRAVALFDLCIGLEAISAFNGLSLVEPPTGSRKNQQTQHMNKVYSKEVNEPYNGSTSMSVSKAKDEIG